MNSDEGEENSDSSYEESVLFQETMSDKKGPPLSDKHLKFLKQNYSQECDPNLVANIKNKYLEPENTDLLSGKTLNPEINKIVSKYARKQDYYMKMIQHNVGVSGTIGFKALEEIKSNKEMPKSVKVQMSKILCDMIIVNAKIMDDMSVMRRQMIKPNLNRKYMDLATQKSYGKYLFGDELTKSLKEVEDSSRATKDLGRYIPPYQSYPSQQPNYPQQFRGNYGSRNFRGRFLARGRPVYRRGYIPQNYYRGQGQRQTKKRKD